MCHEKKWVNSAEQGAEPNKETMAEPVAESGDTSTSNDQIENENFKKPTTEEQKKLPGCVADTDCKGDRICENAICVDYNMGYGAQNRQSPPAAHYYPAHPYQQHQYKPPLPPEPFKKGYWQFSFASIIRSFGRATLEEEGEDHKAKTEGEFFGGFHIGGYRVKSPFLHIGGYFSFHGGRANLDYEERQYGNERGSQLTTSAGFSLKAGKQVSKATWVGFASDFGITLAKWKTSGWDSNFAVGANLYPRFTMNIAVLNSNETKMAINIAFGASILLVAGKPDDDWESLKGRGFLIGPAMMFGISFGS